MRKKNDHFCLVTAMTSISFLFQSCVQMQSTSVPKQALIPDKNAQITLSTGPAVTSLSLTDVFTGSVLAASVSNLSTLKVNGVASKCLSIRANVASSGTASVSFSLDKNDKFSIENKLPFDMMGEQGANGCLSIGTYDVIAAPYSAANRGGVRGADYSARFTIVEGGSATPTPTPVSTPSPTATPVPDGPAPQYFVSPSGSDSNAGSLASPYRTIKKALSMAQPGETVGVRAGTYRETVDFPRSGASGKPITLSAYHHEVAVVSGADVVSGWTLSSGSIFTASVSSPVKDVFVDGKRLRIAQYPPVGWMKTTATTPHTFLTSSDLSSVYSKGLVGAGLYVRTHHWVLEDFTVKSATANRIDFSSPASDDTVASGWGFFVDNKKWMMTYAGSWAWESGKLYIWLEDGSNPSSHTIEISRRSGITIASSANYIAVRELTISKSIDNAIDVAGKNYSLQYNSVEDSGAIGIRVSSSGSGSVSGNSVRRSVRSGIQANYSSSPNTIQNNLVEYAGNAGSPRMSKAGIEASGSNGGIVIKSNTVLYAGYAGIYITDSKNSRVEANRVVGSCAVLTDCAGIYTYGGTGTVARDPMYQVITKNIVGDTTNSSGGTPDTVVQNGIYLDNLSNAVTVSDNVIYNNDSGLLINRGTNNAITRNLFYGNRSGQVTFGKPETMSGNAVTSNTFVPRNRTAPIQSYNKAYGPLNQNNYSTMYDPAVLRVNGRGYSLSQFQADFGQEADGKIVNGFEISQYRVISTGPNLLTSGGFDSGVGSWGAKSADQSNSGTSALNWLSSCGSGSGGCANFTMNSSKDSYLSSPTFSLALGQTYLVKFGAGVASGSGNYVSMKVQQTGAPYSQFGGSSMPITAVWRENGFIFASPATVSSGARLDFTLVPTKANARFDNISIQSANVSDEDPTQTTKLLTNPNPSTLAMACPDSGGSPRCTQYVGLDGTPVTFPLPLPANFGKVIVWSASPFKR